ncbi:MAG TPA: DUF4276 family protein [Phycisphaerales bacterium]|nr:DUF4276 family protein [Phycisphaerales bacterium]
MLAILAEDQSDAEALKVIVRKHLKNESLSIRMKGYDGGGNLLAKGWRDIASWRRRGYTKFLLCHDSDGRSVDDVLKTLRDEVIQRCGLSSECFCLVVPVQELEAWLIADEVAVQDEIPSFRFTGHEHPENIKSPKEWLQDESHSKKARPLYVPKLNNPGIASKLRHDVVARKCPSFRRLLSDLSRCFST